MARRRFRSSERAVVNAHGHGFETTRVDPLTLCSVSDFAFQSDDLSQGRRSDSIQDRFEDASADPNTNVEVGDATAAANAADPV